MLEVKSLTKSFGSFRALDNLSLTVPRGAIMGKQAGTPTPA